MKFFVGNCARLFDESSNEPDSFVLDFVRLANLGFSRHRLGSASNAPEKRIGKALVSFQRVFAPTKMAFLASIIAASISAVAFSRIRQILCLPMMQMLEAGGLPPKTDGIRMPDEDNPRGYYEWESIKQVGSNPLIMNEEGLGKRAIKVVTALLQRMPYNHEYKVIFMMRPVQEIVQSQSAMIARRATQGANLEPEQVARALESHRHSILRWLSQNPRINLHLVNFPSLFNEIDSVVRELVEFVGAELLIHPERMQSVMKKELYRNRQLSD